MMLTHIGRASGKRRHVVVEVVDRDKATNTYYIASAWGEKSDWFQNIHRNRAAFVHIGTRRFAAQAERLSVDEGQKRLMIYAREHPIAFRELTGLMLGERLDSSPENARRLAETIPLVALWPSS